MPENVFCYTALHFYKINIVLSKAITLENNKEGSGNVLLEDQDVAAILQMTKEKLSGQIIAGVFSYFDNSTGKSEKNSSKRL